VRCGGQNPPPRPEPICLLSPSADMTPRWLWAATCQLQTLAIVLDHLVSFIAKLQRHLDTAL
jgi:hypothetical protein